MTEQDRTRWRRNVIEAELVALDRRIEKGNAAAAMGGAFPQAEGIAREYLEVLGGMRDWLLTEKFRAGAKERVA